MAITEDHEKDRCSTAELTTDVRHHGMVSWRLRDGSDRNFGRGRLIDPANADLGLVKQWMLYCERNHRPCRIQNPRTMVEHFRVIDCITLSIISAPTGGHYLALSYVWGHNVPSTADVAGSTLRPDHLPATVMDAINATTRLGFRYLWIDRYCIPDDPRIKHAQIRAMDIIYQHAYATLIGAAGIDATHGLPGVGARSRTSCEKEVHLAGVTIFTTPPHPVTAIERSVWMTRGWTYQEGILSRRRIFFTDEQVYFECNGMQCMEALPPTSLDEWHTRDRQGYLDCVDRSLFTVPTGTVGLAALRHFQSNFTRRALSFDSDSMDAFLGVQAYFESLNPSFRHLWGISFTTEYDRNSRPYTDFYIELTKARVPHTDAFSEARLSSHDRAENALAPLPARLPAGMSWIAEHCFLAGLLWLHLDASKVRRRAEFPSWSWAGWAGSASSLEIGSMYFGCTCRDSRRVPRIVGVEMDESVRPWAEALITTRTLSTASPPLIRQPRVLFIEAQTVPLEVGEIRDPRHRRLVSDGFYVRRYIGEINLLHGRLVNCSIFAKLYLDVDENPLELQGEFAHVGYVGLVIGCGGTGGLLVVRPVPGGGCERVGMVDIRTGSDFVGDLEELDMMPNGEDSYLMQHWWEGNVHRSRTCTAYDIGDLVAVSPEYTATEDWKFPDMVLQTVLR